MVAVWAERIGLDRGAGWGPARWFLLYAGILLFLTPFAGLFFKVLGLGSNAIIRGSGKSAGEASENKNVPLAMDTKVKMLTGDEKYKNSPVGNYF